MKKIVLVAVLCVAVGLLLTAAFPSEVDMPARITTDYGYPVVAPTAVDFGYPVAPPPEEEQPSVSVTVVLPEPPIMPDFEATKQVWLDAQPQIDPTLAEIMELFPMPTSTGEN